VANTERLKLYRYLAAQEADDYLAIMGRFSQPGPAPHILGPVVTDSGGLGQRHDRMRRIITAGAALLALLVIPAWGVGSTPTTSTSSSRGVQFRPVVREGSCPTGIRADTSRFEDAPPAANASVTLPVAGQNDCMTLGPAALVLKGVSSASVSHRASDILSITLQPTDAGALDRAAAAYYHRQLAWILGREVLVAAEVNATCCPGQSLCSSDTPL
jgi:hypothetical protein